MASLQLSKNTVQIIKQALLVATVTKTEEILLDDFGISGRSKTTGILIIQGRDEVFEFTALGIGRVSELKSRLNLIIDDPSLVVEFVEPVMEPGSGNVFKLIFKTTKTKIEYRCMKPERIKTKKNLEDKLIFHFKLDEESVKFMTTGCNAMGSNTVTFRLDENDHLYLQIKDDEGDVLEHLVSKDVKRYPEQEGVPYTANYNVPKLTPLLKSGDVTVRVTRRGAFNLISDGLNIYLLPE
jgi:hypothetical protein